MSEDQEPNKDELNDAPSENSGETGNGKEIDENIVPVTGLYESWFLDYASYVILERAVPALFDGLKPVQRRILHSMKEMEDGRYNKVANIVGNTMKFHPHGDASIGDALVQLGQKELLIDMQGNWGNTLTGDSAAASRYIEARLSKFALHVAFNAKTTHWLASYDGRNKEPDHLPMKFPLLLAQGAEGIAVGLACKILPHNFLELIDNSINHLRGRKVEILPDFLFGGMADFTNYNEGLRGGKVRVRAKINKIDNKTLTITEIPFGSNTGNLIESIIRANDKGKIKIKKIEDNTAEFAEIMIHLAPGVSPDKTIDALYAFTDCEVSISPNSSTIDKDAPKFLGVNEMLRINTDNTVQLLKWELEIRKNELEEQWHFSSLEKIFIENKVYSLIEDEETWEGVITAIDNGLIPFTKHLKRAVNRDDIIRLTEIKIKRISKFDAFRADEILIKLEEELAEVEHKLNNLIDYAVDYFKDLKKRFGEGKERRTEIKIFDNINASKVVIANKKLYVDMEEGFIGYGLKKNDYVQECSDLDDIIVFFETGKMMVTKISDKKFVGKGIVHATVWKKGDKRTIYHVLYSDGKTGPTYMKRFFVNSITRDKEYDLTKGIKGSQLLYFACHPNGEREVITVMLRPRTHLKKLRLDIDMGEQLIKSRTAGGNLVTKELVSKVTQKEVGGSTLAARKIWYDEVVGRLNDEKRGKFLGDFRGEDKILTLYKSGEYRLSSFDLTTHFDDDMFHIEKWNPEHAISAVYYDGEKEIHFVKRFLCEVTSDKKVSFINESEGSQLNVATTAHKARVKIIFNKLLKATKNLPDKEILLDEFIDVKGMKTQGNQLTKLKVKEVVLTLKEGDEIWPDDEDEEDNTDPDDTDDDGNDGDDDNDSPDNDTPDNSESAELEEDAKDDETEVAKPTVKSTTKKPATVPQETPPAKTESTEDAAEEIKKVKPKSLSSLRPKDGEGPREVEWDFTKAKRRPPTRRRDDDDDAQPKLFDLE